MPRVNYFKGLPHPADHQGVLVSHSSGTNLAHHSCNTLDNAQSASLNMNHAHLVQIAGLEFLSECVRDNAIVREAVMQRKSGQNIFLDNFLQRREDWPCAPCHVDIYVAIILAAC
jgi:hypothetical protein